MFESQSVITIELAEKKHALVLDEDTRFNSALERIFDCIELRRHIAATDARVIEP